MIDGQHALHAMRRITRIQLVLSVVFCVLFAWLDQWVFAAVFAGWVLLSMRELRKLRALELRLHAHIRQLQAGELAAVREARDAFPENPGSA